MRYALLGSSNLKVSVVSLGTWVMGGDNWGTVDDKESIGTIQKAIELGINLIDTSPVYGSGHAEEIVGKAIKGSRDRVYIASKCGLKKEEGRFVHDLRPSSLRKELENSLSLLGIDCVDLYQCHWPDPKNPIEDTFNEMLAMQSEGKITSIGVCNFDLSLLKKAVKIAPIVSIQLPYSLLDRTIEEDNILQFCMKKKIGVMAYGSLGGGILTGKYKRRPTFPQKDARRFFYPFYNENEWDKYQSFVDEIKKIAREKRKPLTQVALNWLIQRPGLTTAIVGARTPIQVEINANAAHGGLLKNDFLQIENFYNKFIKKFS